MNAFWNLGDVAVWIGLAVPSLLAGATLAKLLVKTPAIQLIAVQFIAYVIWFVLLKLLFQLQYRMPFWSSLGFVVPSGGILVCLAAGPLLSIAVSAIALLIRAPLVDPPFKELLVSRQYRAIFALAGVIAGPFCEELVFRGFLMPALSKAMGTALGIVVTGVAFSLLHGPQNHWIWQWLLALAVAGSAFGWARWRYQSTFSSTILHASFNCTAFVAQIYG
jgi:membrane protease YdiL (CAAX protease family)